MDLLTKVSPERERTEPPEEFLANARAVRRIVYRFWRTMTPWEHASSIADNCPYWVECEVRNALGRVVFSMNYHITQACKWLHAQGE